MQITLYRILQHRFAGGGRVEASGFYQGAHGGSVEDGVAEITAHYDGLRAELQKTFYVVTKKFEAELENINQIAPVVERLWAGIQERFSERLPHLFTPAAVAVLGLFALLAEAKLLSPSMDVLYVTDPDWQLFTAWGLVSIAALSFHFAWESFKEECTSAMTRLIWRVVAAGFAVALVFWGIFRGYQVAFAASVTGNPLGEFLNGHPILSSIFYVAVTLGTPLAASTATHFAVHNLHDWYEYHHAKNEAERISKRRAQVTKMLESESEQLRKGVEKLEAECAENQAKYRQHHDRGGQFGAVQEPFWTVPMKTTLSTLAAAVGFFWLMFLLPILFGILLAAVWIAAFLYFRRQWQSPDPEEFFENERVQYAIRAADQHIADFSPIESPTPRLVQSKNTTSDRELTK